MRQLAIYNGKLNPSTVRPDLQDLQIEGVTVRCKINERQAPSFDHNSPEHAEKVLVHVTAFSCNYRDKALILRAATRLPRGASYVIGSEFAGEIVEVGSNVDTLKVGDRVMGDNTYPYRNVPGIPAGVVTNHASTERQILHPKQLMKVPDTLSDAEAASFSIGAQTVTSMIRKLDLQEGENILVTAATSNTSLFAIHSLKHRPVKVTALTTREAFADDLRVVGADSVVVVQPNKRLRSHAALVRILGQIGGFDAVIDPLYDLYFPDAVQVLRYGGRYITCGLADQTSTYTGQPKREIKISLEAALSQAITKNLHIIGNCIGTTEDLAHALQAHQAGKLQTTIDSIYSQGNVVAFLERTYNDRSRFGKVVYQYASADTH
ncbi:MAG: zinc-binding alcohol dehydrogenase family protein [Chloroflexi bacterium]|nr:zinc-binding alcohol dehydrogenase family protein [Chloroflexota bacterium]